MQGWYYEIAVYGCNCWLQFGLYHVIAPLSFLRSVSLASLFVLFFNTSIFHFIGTLIRTYGGNLRSYPPSLIFRRGEGGSIFSPSFQKKHAWSQVNTTAVAVATRTSLWLDENKNKIEPSTLLSLRSRDHQQYGAWTWLGSRFDHKHVLTFLIEYWKLTLSSF